VSAIDYYAMRVTCDLLSAEALPCGEGRGARARRRRRRAI